MPEPTLIHRPNLTPANPAESNLQHNPSSHNYYDLSILKPPVWRWQIASYFFLGGLSAGAYLLARIADRFGGKDFRYVAKIGTYTACAAALPCPALLIWDLGDPARFHHMLRVFKPASAMNLGTWVLTAITPIAFGAAAREFAIDSKLTARHPRIINAVVETIGVIADAAGIPLAVLLATYTGVLLSNSANPIWSHNKFLAPLFAIGSFSTGISAISLVHQIATYNQHSRDKSQASKVMEKLDTIGHIAEAGVFATYLVALGPQRKAYTQTNQKKHVIAHFSGLLVAEGLKYIPLPKPLQRPAKVTSCVLGLCAAFSLRWAIVHAAHHSAKDPDSARNITRAKDLQLKQHYNQFPLLAPPDISI